MTTGVFPAAGPDDGLMPVAVGGGTGMQAENSDVFPEGSVAVAQGAEEPPVVVAEVLAAGPALGQLGHAVEIGVMRHQPVGGVVGRATSGDEELPVGGL